MAPQRIKIVVENVIQTDLRNEQETKKNQLLDRVVQKIAILMPFCCLGQNNIYQSG